MVDSGVPLCPSCGHAEHNGRVCCHYETVPASAPTFASCTCFWLVAATASVPPPLPAKQPFRCPVCMGSGTVPLGGDSYSTQEYPCHACGGKGIVWSE